MTAPIAVGALAEGYVDGDLYAWRLSVTPGQLWEREAERSALSTCPEAGS